MCSRYVRTYGTRSRNAPFLACSNRAARAQQGYSGLAIFTVAIAFQQCHVRMSAHINVDIYNLYMLATQTEIYTGLGTLDKLGLSLQSVDI